MKKILTIFGIMLVMLFALAVNSNAYTYSVKLNPAKSTLNPGDTVTVDLVIDSIVLEAGEPGIIGLEAGLNYDNKVFSKASVSGNEQWSSGENITKIKGIFFSNEVKGTGKLATITLTVADDAEIGETTVTLNNIQTANGVSDGVSANDSSVKFTIAELSNNEDNNANDDANKNEDDNVKEDEEDKKNEDDKANNTVANTNKVDNTIANKVISAAGLENAFGVVVAILIAVVGISYISYKKYNNM